MAAGDALNGLAIGALPWAADLMVWRAQSRLDEKGWHPSSPFAKGASRPPMCVCAHPMEGGLTWAGDSPTGDIVRPSNGQDEPHARR